MENTPAPVTAKDKLVILSVLAVFAVVLIGAAWLLYVYWVPILIIVVVAGLFTGVIPISAIALVFLLLIL